jgi:corrinoid protein of di/trimethylamine methyltransferase
MDPLRLLNEGLTAGLNRVGDLFSAEEIFLPSLIISGRIVTQAVETLKPHLEGGKDLKKKALCLMATIQGDVHDIGKNIVSILLAASGYDIVDLGKDVTVQHIVDKIGELNPDMIGLSTLLTTTMPVQKQVIDAVEEAGYREGLKIMVGGAPVTRAWAEEIGADGYAEDAVGAVREADRLMGVVLTP